MLTQMLLLMLQLLSLGTTLIRWFDVALKYQIIKEKYIDNMGSHTWVCYVL
jgi:hypothetical protein